MARKKKNFEKKELIKDDLVINDELKIKKEENESEITQQQNEKEEKEKAPSTSIENEKKQESEEVGMQPEIIKLSEIETLTIYSVKFDQFEKLDMKNAPELITLHEGKLIIIPYDKKEPKKIIIKNTALALRLRAEYLPQNKVIVLEPRPGSVRVNVPKSLQIEIL